MAPGDRRGGTGMAATTPDGGGARPAPGAETLDRLDALQRKVLWLSSWMIHHANHLRPNRTA